MQLGEAAEFFSPDETHSKFKNRVTAVNLLERVGFESIHAYEEVSGHCRPFLSSFNCTEFSLDQSHCGFMSPWTYIVAFKSFSTRKRWYANSAEINLAIQKRSVRTHSGTSPFRIFDGSTMVSYQMPPKALETVFCRQEPTPETCLNCENAFCENSNAMPDDLSGKSHQGTSIFNPAADRHLTHTGSMSIGDIMVSDEILANNLT
jgi:hypothetical protein